MNVSCVFSFTGSFNDCTMPVTPNARAAQRDFFTKLFKRQSQQAFLICDAKIVWLKITIDFCHHIFLASKVISPSFFFYKGKEMLFVCVCVGQQRKSTDLANGPL